MPSPATSHELHGALETFETCLLSPVVAGELVSWAQAAQQAMQELLTHERLQLAAVHQQEFAEIARQDPDLSTRVEQLQDEDGLIGQELLETQQQLNDLVAAAEAAEPDELRVETLRARVEERGLSIVLRIRRQEAAARTWLVESFQRDRGDVD